MHGRDCGALIRHIHCAMQKNANNELRAEDLTFAQVHLLFTLKSLAGKDCPMKELERKMGVAQSTTAGLVKRCGEKGLIDCFEDPSDRRVKLVRITEKGLLVCEDTEFKIRRSEERLVKNLSQDERDVLINLLQKVYSAVSQPE